MQAKAAVAYTAGKPLEVTTVELEGPRAGEVLVEIKATGICAIRATQGKGRSIRSVVLF